MKRLPLLFSLAACAGITFIWARSHYATDVLLYGTSGTLVAQSPHDPSLSLSMVAIQTAEEGGQNRLVILFGRLRIEAAERRGEEWELHRNGFALYRGTPQLVYKPWHLESEWFSVHDSWCGFEITKRDRDLVDCRERAITIPYWMLLALTVAYPLGLSLQMIWNCRRNRRGCCAACGYDLRATPQRCPECGLVPASS